jgi:hypothetical protein
MNENDYDIVDALSVSDLKEKVNAKKGFKPVGGMTIETPSGIAPIIKYYQVVYRDED